MLVLTWNLRGQQKALKLACKYLATHGTCIACFQELPEGTTPRQIRTWSNKTLEPLTPLVDQRVVIVVSRDVRVTQQAAVFVPGAIRDAAERMVGASVATPTLHRGERYEERSQLADSGYKDVSQGAPAV